MATEVAIAGGDSHDLKSLLSSSDRDFLVRNNGDQVKIESLKGKKVGLYFSASWCGPCQRFTPSLAEAYNELSSKGDFEIVFVSADEDDESFNTYFSKMPWLAIPFSDSNSRDHLDELFKVMGIPHLVILDDNGKVLTDSGVEIIGEYGVKAYPFTPERVNEIKEEEEEAKRNQTLKSVLVSNSRDYVVSADGKQVPIAELEGKIIGLYFSLSTYDGCTDFAPKLVEVYEKLKSSGENFEIVMIPLDDEEEEFKEGLKTVPWLSLPFKDKTCEKLIKYFELSALPSLVIIGSNGKTLHSNVAEAVEEHGVMAYPFTPDKFAELEEIEKKKRESQTLETILVSGENNFMIGKDGVKIPVSDVVGKTVLLYFSAHWCPPCRAFLPILIETYEKLKAKHALIEVVFISSDRDQGSFDEFFSTMPWLALPFGDTRKALLNRLFKVQGIPKLIAISPEGKTLTTEARGMVSCHGEKAYPFTKARLDEIEEEYKEMTKGWPEKLEHELHDDHELVLRRREVYTCDGCDEEGSVWAFNCEECDFDLHPKCCLGEEILGKKEDLGEKMEEEGWVCDGEVCHKA